MEAFHALTRDAMVVTAMLCIPVLGIAALVGTLVAILQAATQVQEQTLTLLPKLVAVGITIALFGAFGMRACAALFGDAIAAIPVLVHG
jgi:flagellar biosynthesis protein FliQ